ncbi:MAG: hypothetical protein AAFQ14_20245 [Cyanobacteria bacterium J06621_12]
MKRTLFTTLSVLALALTAAPAFATEVAALGTQSANNIVKISPFNLVGSAYQGSFTDRGIPGYTSFVKAANGGRVTAKDLVKLAIADGRLAPETINNRGYLSSVASHLRNLDED